MEDDLTPAHGPASALVVLDVGLDQFDVREKVGEVVTRPRGQVVEHPDVVPLLEEPLHQV